MLGNLVLHEVAMLQPCKVPLRHQAVIDVLCCEDAAVHAARTADGDDKLTLSLLDVLRNEKIHHAVEMLQKLLRH